MKNLSDDWYALGPSYIRRLMLYKLALDDCFNFDDFFISMGNFSGPIAYLQHPKCNRKPILKITTSSGQLIIETTWKDADPVCIGWSTSDELAVVQSSGYVTLLSLNGDFKRRFSFGREAENTQIVQAKFFIYENHTAAACLTGSGRFFIATNLERPRILSVADLPQSSRSHCLWEIVTPRNDVSSTISDSFNGPWILASSLNQFYRLGVGKLVKVEMLHTNLVNVSRMCISKDAQLLALYLVDNLLWVGNLDLTDVKLEVTLTGRISPLTEALQTDTNSPIQLPSTMKWLDSSAVVLLWNNFVVLVDLNGNICEFFYEKYIHTDTEIDGIRILTSTRHELLQYVPPSLEALGRIGASCPGALLLSAFKNWEVGQGGAHEFLHTIKTTDKMREAVDQCILAACHSALTPIATQKLLLNAARFGRGFLSMLLASTKRNQSSCCESINEISQRTVEVCNTLRFLNNLTSSWVSMAITWQQFTFIGPLALLHRLLSRGHYPMAIELVRFNQQSVTPSSLLFPDESAKLITSGMTRILSHWVERLSIDPDKKSNISVVLSRLKDILRKITGSDLHERSISTQCLVPGLSFTDVASKAVECGHKDLAEKLLELEPRSFSEIPLLLRLNKFESALTRAVNSGNSDLIMQVLLALQQQDHLDANAVSMLLRQHPTALAFYRQHLDRDNFSNHQLFNKPGSAHITSQTLLALQNEDEPALRIKNDVLAAFSSRDLATRTSGLQKAKESYQQIRNDFLAQSCEEAAKLANFHCRLEQQRITAPILSLDTCRFPRSSVNSVSSEFPSPSRGGVRTSPMPKVSQVAASHLSMKWQGNSISLTYVRLVVAKQERLADQMRRDFRLPEKLVGYLRLIGLALTSDGWLEIEKMAAAKKPLVSLEAIVKVYIDSGRGNDAMDLVARLPMESRIRYLLLLGHGREAISLATQDRSGNLLHLIQRLVHKTDREIYEEVEHLRARLM